jgi:hypothetical protein
LYLRTKGGAALPAGIEEEDVLDYPKEKAKFDRYREAQKARRAGLTSTDEIDADAPHEDWRLYQALNALQGDDGTNKAAEAILKEGPEGWKKILREALEELSRGEVIALKWPLNLVQLFNPQAAKGYARLKPDSTDRNDATKNQWGEPFMEWLKYRGYFRVACPFFLGSKGENVRLLCPIPERIERKLLNTVVGELRRSPIFGSAPKLDCLAALKLAEILIKRSKEFQGECVVPSQLVSGLMIAHYQSMGQSKAVTSIERLALPDWFPISNAAEADLWLNILDEHQKVLRSLKDDRSDEIGLLIAYRRFLEMRGKKSVDALLSFLGDYGVFLMRERERDKTRKLKQFLTVHVRSIVMQEPDYHEILENPGFKAIAAAIRTATVSAQARKRLQATDYRNIRYGLLPELRRKRTLPNSDSFLEAIADFVVSYNAESARRFEMGKATGTRRVTTEELECFVGLLSKLPKQKASAVGALLCAYASCREPREAEGEEMPEENKDTGEVQNG